MNRNVKIVGAIVIVLVTIILVLAFTADDYIESEIADLIKTVPKNISIEYEDMEFNTFQGNLIFKNSQIKFKDPKSDSVISTIKINDISILDIGYWEYFKNKNVIVQNLVLKNPYIVHRQIKSEKDSTEVIPDADKAFKTVLHIDNFIIDDAKFELRDFLTDSLIFGSEHSDITVNKVLIDSTVTDLIPFKYDSYQGNLKNVYYKIGDYENLRASNIAFNPNQIDIKEITLKTKYSRVQHTKLLKNERDWYNIQIDSAKFANTAFGKTNDSINKFSSNSIDIYQPRVSIFRNKLIADEYEVKKYYGSLLRELPLQLTLDTINLINGDVSYEEKVIAENAPGKLTFKNFNATIKNFSNTYKAPKITTIDINTLFMGSAALKVNWQFDVNNKQDEYLFEVELDRFNTESLYQFTKNNLNVSLEGTLNKTYFTISGTKFNSHIDLQINYDDFRVKLLKDEGKKKKTILTALVNIFIRKNSDKATNDFRKGSDDIGRNQYKSFYSNLWMNVRAGLRKAITGDANKKDQ